MAKKSKGFRELLSQQSPKKIERQSLEALEKKLARDGISTEFIPSPKGAKMCEALEELVRPYVNIADDEESLQGLFSMGIFAWNIAAAPKEDRQGLFDKAFATMKSQGIDFVEQKDLVKILIERKEKLFPDNCRKIMNFELNYIQRGEYHISVASTIE